MGSPLISRRFSGKISGPPSIGLPRPSKTRLSISALTPSCMLLPKKRTLLLERLIPAEFSNNCTNALPPSISSTLQRRFSPFASSISPRSLYRTSSTPLTSIRGPATSSIVLYSFGIRNPLLCSLRFPYQYQAAPSKAHILFPCLAPAHT